MAVPEYPNSGRILDYWLGGTHHFPADIAAADQFITLYADFPQVFRELRGFIGRTSRYIHAQGVDRFLVLGAGIPTQGNVHEAVPNAKVLYSDNDPNNVEIGKKILVDNPRCDYLFCDATDLASLDSEAMNAVLGAEGPLGIIFVGFACFISDDVLSKIFGQLYDMAPPNSYLAADFDSFAMPPAVGEAFKAAGLSYTLRVPDTIRPLFGKWQPTQHGILPVALWDGDKLNVQNSGESVFEYGVVLTK